MAEVVGEGNGFGEAFVEAEGTGHAAGDGSDLDGVGQAGPVMIAGAVEEDLGFVVEAAEGAAVNDAVAVALVKGSVEVGFLLVQPPASVATMLGIRGQPLVFELFLFFAQPHHDVNKIGHFIALRKFSVCQFVDNAYCAVGMKGIGE